MQIIEIGAEEQKPAQKKPIELVKALTDNFDFKASFIPVTDYNRIELICRDYSNFASQNFDLIFCMFDSSNRSAGVLYLGHWNDGVV